MHAVSPVEILRSVFLLGDNVWGVSGPKVDPFLATNIDLAYLKAPCYYKIWLFSVKFSEILTKTKIWTPTPKPNHRRVSSVISLCSVLGMTNFLLSSHGDAESLSCWMLRVHVDEWYTSLLLIQQMSWISMEKRAKRWLIWEWLWLERHVELWTSLCLNRDESKFQLCSHHNSNNFVFMFASMFARCHTEIKHTLSLRKKPHPKSTTHVSKYYFYFEQHKQPQRRWSCKISPNSRYFRGKALAAGL